MHAVHRDQVAEGNLKDQIAALGQQPGLEYLKDLANDPKIKWDQVKLAHDSWSYSQQGLTGAGAALLPFGLIFVQPDLGSALIYLPLSFALLFVAGLSSRFFMVAGLASLVLAAVVAVGVLPAVLALLGTRINALAPRRWRERSERAAEVETSGGWYRLSQGVMRRPAIVAPFVTRPNETVLDRAALGLGGRSARTPYGAPCAATKKT